jgi:acetyltransferase-like isoleucine patch superfamily enzyme
MREAVKLAVYVTAKVVALPALISFHIRAAVLGRDRAITSSTQTLSLIPGLTGQYIRRAFLASALEHCDRSATIEFGVLFSQAGARIEPRVYVGPRCHLGLVHLEQDVLLGAGVHVPSGAATHGTDDALRPIREQPGTRTRVRIGEGTWVGSGAIVMADVGKHVVVAAGAVVTKPLPDYVVAAGVPARIIRDRRAEVVRA